MLRLRYRAKIAMTYYLFLDDERMPGDWYKDKVVFVARNYNQFVATIREHGWPVQISFDHDLGDGPTGADCAKWLYEFVDESNTFPSANFSWCVHSQNPIGAANIRGHMKHLERFLDFVHNG
jgi:hypothetical protein